MCLQFEHAKTEITFGFVFCGVKNKFRRMIIDLVDSVQSLLSSYPQLIILVLFDNIIVRLILLFVN